MGYGRRKVEALRTGMNNRGRRVLRLAVRKGRQLRAEIMEKEFASSGKQK